MRDDGAPSIPSLAKEGGYQALCFAEYENVTRTIAGQETSETIRFKGDLPQGDLLCPRLFTICLNSIAWKLKSTGVYRLSKTDQY